MLPTLVIVGRPNVGKSTLFNRLTKSRDALVHDQPGLTRDRHYGHGRVGGKPFLVVDTGGFEPVADSGILHEMARQTLQAVDEADVIVFLVDGRGGITPQDKLIANRLRTSGRPVFVAVNKSEGLDPDTAAAEFHELGLGEPIAISSAHGERVGEFVELALAGFEFGEPAAEPETGIRVAIVGRPNVGKSTLVNALVGEERVIAFDQPGTTRDAIDVPFERAGRRYVLIDTAGVRRKGRVFETVEKFSVIKTMQAIEDANVVILMFDARADISDQDAHLAGFIVDAGRALVIAVNKWDGMDEYARDNVKREVARRFTFLDFARLHYISALNGTGLDAVMRSVDEAYAAATAKLPTPKLTRILIDCVSTQPPARSGLFRPKPRFAHQGGMNPPVVVVHGNALAGVQESWKRFFERRIRETFKLFGTPLRIEFKEGRNPYEGKKKVPTKSELNRARREKRFRRRAYG